MTAYERLEPLAQNSDAWHARRAEGVGASDVAGILGLSPWSTPLDVYRQKKGMRRDINAEDAFFGHAAEREMRDWLLRFHPELGDVQEGASFRSLTHPWLTVAPDLLVTDRERLIPVEVKNTMRPATDWDDGVPVQYQVQVQTQIAVLDAPYGWIAVRHHGTRAHLHRVRRDDAFIVGNLLPVVQAFWHEHVLAEVPPEPTTKAEIDDVYASEQGSQIEASETARDSMEQRNVLLSDKRDIETQLVALELALGQYMGSAETLTWDGVPIATYKTQTGRKSVSVADVERDYPEIAEDLVKRGRDFKVLRAVKEKK